MNTNVNRNHKDSVFSVLFGTPDVLRDTKKIRPNQ